MMRDLALGLRLAVGGGRMSGAALLRLAMTGAQAERKAAIAQVTEPRAGVTPLLVHGWGTVTSGEDDE